MNQFINSIKNSLSNENWHAALISCLILPDVCGKIEDPNLSSKNRYLKWFKIYLSDKYPTREVGTSHERTVFLSAESCYALRCSLLHEGSSEVSEQQIKQALSDFLFIIPEQNMHIHCNLIGNRLQLQIDTFCLDFINAVEKWLNDINGNVEKQEKIKKLLKIVSLRNGF